MGDERESPPWRAKQVQLEFENMNLKAELAEVKRELDNKRGAMTIEIGRLMQARVDDAHERRELSQELAAVKTLIETDGVGLTYEGVNELAKTKRELADVCKERDELRHVLTSINERVFPGSTDSFDAMIGIVFERDALRTANKALVQEQDELQQVREELKKKIEHLRTALASIGAMPGTNPPQTIDDARILARKALVGE